MIILNCLGARYNYSLLAVAVVICAIGSSAGVKTFIRARYRPESDHAQWATIATIAIASTAWTTHFLELLAHESEITVVWNVPVTVLSLAAVILSTALGVVIGTRRSLPLAPELGGFVIGLGIAAMHAIGMMAYEVQGRYVWNVPRVEISVVVGAVLGAVALGCASRPSARPWKYSGAAGLLLCICAIHLTGMSALTIIPDRTVVLDRSVSTALFGYGVAAVATMLILSVLAIYEIDKKTSRKSEDRLRKLANATIEGIVILRGPTINDVNDRFLALTGYRQDRVVGTRADRFWDLATIARAQHAQDGIDCEIVAADATVIPVHVTCTAGGEQERIVTVRDLRAKHAVEARLLHLATHDALTGAVNRAHFAATMDAIIAADKAFSVLYIDLDGFKEINDGKGHSTGDAVLVEMTRRMFETLPSATVARIGGDEFAILQPHSPLSDDYAELLAEVLRQPFLRDGASIALGASIGVSRFPDNGRAADLLLANADLAMYAAKADGKSGVCRYDAGMGEAATRRRKLSADLAFASQGAQIELHYQVQTSVLTGAPTGFEALARWNHPTLGVIKPDEFIPLAEETGAIVAIGRFVLRQACLDAASWADELTVAVNLSPAQFKDDIPALVHEVLQESGLAASRLELEITESLLIQNPEHVLAVLKALKAQGIRIAMDDFGTGYSSLQTLNVFPFDKIKIDRSFVDKTERSPQAAAIVRAVVNLGHSLAIPVLAEGVEKPEHLAYLRRLGCSDAQGYLIGRPTPAAGTAAHMTPNVADNWNDAALSPSNALDLEIANLLDLARGYREEQALQNGEGGGSHRVG